MNKYTIHILTFMFLWCCGAGASATELYFVHSDHLNTPQVITDFNQQVVWEGKRLPFGETDVTSTQIEFNLRFPGQYYDLETGLHYNYFRDYDPSLGRYLQSDPIGLNGGINTYGYANQNPVSNIDPLGLKCITYTKNGSTYEICDGGPDEKSIWGGYNTGEYSAGMEWYTPTDLRTNEERSCAQCQFSCSIATLFAPGPTIPTSAKEVIGWGASYAGTSLYCSWLCEDDCEEKECYEDKLGL